MLVDSALIHEWVAEIYTNDKLTEEVEYWKSMTDMNDTLKQIAYIQIGTMYRTIDKYKTLDSLRVDEILMLKNYNATTDYELVKLKKRIKIISITSIGLILLTLML